VAIGNPFGLSHSLAVGLVSAIGRTSLGIGGYKNFIQTDAAINPGNAGGPLVNLDKEAVGMNTAIFSRSEGYRGVAFAIPVNLAKAMAQQLVEHGTVTRGYRGVVIQALTPDLAESFGLKQRRGVLIARVNKDSPADKAGIKAGGDIVNYQGGRVTDAGNCRNRVALTAPGSAASLTVLRKGVPREVRVTLGKIDTEKFLFREPYQSAQELGLTVQTLTPVLARQFDATSGEGIVVTEFEAESMAAMAGIHHGSVILQVYRGALNFAAELKRAIDSCLTRKRVLLLVRDRGHVPQRGAKLALSGQRRNGLKPLGRIS